MEDVVEVVLVVMVQRIVLCASFRKLLALICENGMSCNVI